MTDKVACFLMQGSFIEMQSTNVLPPEQPSQLEARPFCQEQENNYTTAQHVLLHLQPKDQGTANKCEQTNDAVKDYFVSLNILA